MLRDHDAIVLEEFNGLWARGDTDSVPIDHFSDCENIQFIRSGFKTRDGLDTYRGVADVVRIYNYVRTDGETILALDIHGNLYHVVDDTTIYLILSIPNMSDFGFVGIAGRAYITPFTTSINSAGRKYQHGLNGNFLYVYKGDGTPARKAAGLPPTGSAIVASNSATTGFNDVGLHLFGVIYETDTGYLTPPALFTSLTTVDGTKAIDISNVPVSPSSFVTKRHIVATVVVPNFNGNFEGYQYFFVPDGTIDDNIGTTITISFYDLDLLEDASHLLDNFSEIPAGVTLTTYHGRLVLTTTFNDISIAYLSAPGEPEAIDQVDGFVIAPLDGNPITTAQEYRDVLYIFKRTRTLAYNDNGDVPSSWPLIIIDQGVGCSVHGIGTVLDSGGINIDFLLIVDFSGLMIFNGAYTRPELSWKIRDRWFAIDRNDFSNIQIMNDSLTQVVYITLPDRKMLLADYTEGMNAKDIKWAPWRFDVETSTITLVETNKLIIGSQKTLVT